MLAVEIIAVIQGKRDEKAVDRAVIGNQTGRTVISRGLNVESGSGKMPNKSQIGRI
jgi:hypothetical protein